MSIIRAIFMIFVILCTGSAMADCKVGDINIAVGKQLAQHKGSIFCAGHNIKMSDQTNGKEFAVVCRQGNKLACVARSCTSNKFKLDKNGVCVIDRTRAYHENVVTTDNKTSDFFESCTDSTAAALGIKTLPDYNNRKIKVKCVLDFKDIKVSRNIALQLIEKSQVNGVDNVQRKNCTTRLSKGNKAIQCKSDSGVYLEYIFGSMHEPYLQTKDLAEQLCPFYGMDYLGRTGPNRCAKTATTTEAACKALNNVLAADYFKAKLVTGSRVCEITNNTSSNPTDLPQIDPEIFADINSYANSVTTAVMKQYINNSFSRKPSIEFYSARDNLWPIKINGKTALFRFKSLSTKGWGSDFISKVSYTSAEQMSCVIQDGLLDGRHCWFVEAETDAQAKQLCTQRLNTYIKTFFKGNNSVGAESDTDGVCTLKRSNKEYNTAKWIQIGSQVVGLVLTSVALPGSGLMSAVFTLTGIVTDGVAIGEEIYLSHSGLKFLKQSTKCKDTKCAGELFDKEFLDMLQKVDRIDATEVKAVDKEMSRLIDEIPENSGIIKKFIDMKQTAAATMSTAEVIQTVASLFSLASAGGNIGTKFLEKTGGTAPKFLVKFQQKAKKLVNAANTASRLYNSENMLYQTGSSIDNGNVSISNIQGAAAVANDLL